MPRNAGSAAATTEMSAREPERRTTSSPRAWRTSGPSGAHAASTSAHKRASSADAGALKLTLACRHGRILAARQSEPPDAASIHQTTHRHRTVAAGPHLFAAEADICPSAAMYRYAALGGCSRVVTGTAMQASGVKESR